MPEDRSTFAQLMAGMEAIPMPPEARAGLVDLIRLFDGKRLSVNAEELDRKARITEAVRLLDIGRDRAAICRRLKHAFGVSQSTARRDVVAALDERAKRSRPANL